MRIGQFTPIPNNPDPAPLLFFVLPINGTAKASVRPDRYKRFRNKLTISINGWTMVDGQIEPVAYVDPQSLLIRFSGSVGVQAQNYQQALVILRAARFQIEGWCEGELRDVDLQIGHVVSWCRPGDPDEMGWMTLIGADR